MLRFTFGQQIPIQHQHAVYNALDCCITSMLREELEELIEGTPTALIVNYLNAISSVTYQMQTQGFNFDRKAADKKIETLTRQIKTWKELFATFSLDLCGKEINPNSSQQLKYLFNKALGLPEFTVKVAKTKEERDSANREALEAWAQIPSAAPLANLILAIRKNEKQVQVLSRETPNNRYYFSFNPAGTDTWRFSSKAHDWLGGSNIQNIAPALRSSFVPDPGNKIAYVDLAQAEARLVGALCYVLFGISTYLDACEAGDLHTFVARGVWPDLPWPDDPAGQKALAEQKFYLDFSRRDLAKRGGHGTNYGVKPKTMSKHLRIDLQVAKRFQTGYFASFPEIKMYHHYVEEQLRNNGSLTNLFGFERQFQKMYSNSLLLEGIAFPPQSTIGIALNMALLKCSNNVRNFIPIVQVHDAIVFQYPAECEVQVISDVLREATLEFTLHSPDGKPRKFCLPADAKTGWNWGYADEKNPNGLKTWKGEDTRKFNRVAYAIGLSSFGG